MTPPGTTDERTVVRAVAAATFLTLMTFTAPLSTIGATGDALGAGVGGRAWILSSMSVGLAATLLSAGAVADDVGRRRAFVVGLGLLAASSVACALAPSTLVFVLARVAQGVGGAAITAAGLGMLGHAFPAGPARAAATGVWGASVGAGIAVGPLVSAACERWSSWRDVYVLLAALALVIAWAAARRLPESRSLAPRGIDTWGVILVGTGMSLVLGALVEARQGVAGAEVWALGVGGVALLVAFLVVESRVASPMIELGLLRVPEFRAATIGAFTTGTGPIALFSFLTAFTGLALGFSPMRTAVLLLAWSATSVVFALLARRLPASISGRARLGGGMAVLGLALLTLGGLGTDSGALRFLPGLLVAGAASGIVNAALGREAVASVPVERGAMGSGANNTARYLGSALGVTVVAVVVAGQGTTAAELVAGWDVAVVVCASTCFVGALGIAVWGAPRATAH